MSKIGKKPIAIPEGVTAALKDGTIEVKGKNATLTVPVLEGVKVEIKDKNVTITSDKATKQASSNWGTVSAHLKNALAGASTDFSKELLVMGIGFKAALEGKDLVLNLGFSHPVRFAIPQGIKVTVEKNAVKVAGPDRWLVGETAARIRDFRRPEPYQGKGIRYKDEIVRKKAGKKAAALWRLQESRSAAKQSH